MSCSTSSCIGIVVRLALAVELSLTWDGLSIAVAVSIELSWAVVISVELSLTLAGLSFVF
jgi:hypothetical protein